MADTHFYYTIQKPATAEHKDKGSRFLAFIFPIESVDEAKEKIKVLKKEHPKANHHCFAYRIGWDGNNFRTSDDGEPSGSAGKPILGQIDSKGVVNVMIAVVRYFGGTLLGIPGLIHAYKTAASLALQLTPVVQKPVVARYHLFFDYTVMSDVMNLMRQYHCTILQQEGGMFCTLQTGIPIAQEEEATQQLRTIKSLEIKKL